MTSDLDIWRSAQVLMKRHGEAAPIEDASIEAAMRADELLAAGRPDFRFLVCFLPFA